MSKRKEINTNSIYTKDDEIATSFVIEIIDEAMKRFNITFNELDAILIKLDYWKVFNDSEVTVTVAGAHEGIEPILARIQAELHGTGLLNIWE